VLASARVLALRSPQETGLGGACTRPAPLSSAASVLDNQISSVRLRCTHTTTPLRWASIQAFNSLASRSATLLPTKVIRPRDPLEINGPGMAKPLRQFTHSDYTVGWICALSETELAAAGAMLDEEHPNLPAADPRDANVYLLGKIGSHNVVVACLPAGKTGKVSAATVATDMIRSFKALRFGLMVGVGGGAPYYVVKGNEDAESGDHEQVDSEEEDVEGTQDIRLGDVVISLHSKSTEAVVQYDFGKSVQGKEFIRAGGMLNKPPNIILTAVAMLQGQHARKGHKLSEQLSDMVLRNPGMAKKFKYPGLAKDQLFISDCIHLDDKKQCRECCKLTDANLAKRNPRRDTAVKLHYGTIGSADQVMKDAKLRDKWAEKEKIMCFEMEAAGKF
jgi:nucleoside phosphorylase